MASVAILRQRRWVTPLLVALGGVLLAMASPHWMTPVAWALFGIPLFLALDLTLRHHAGGRAALWGKVLACTFPAGVVFAAIAGDWVTNTAHVFGGMPLPVALATTWFGFGGLIGLEIFFFLGVPFALSWRRPWLALALVPLWCTVFQMHLPRFLFFTFGQTMLSVPELVQFADVGGSGALNLLLLPAHLAGYLWIRHGLFPGDFPRRHLGVATGILILGFAVAYGYGSVSMDRWKEREARGREVELLGIQPNFTLARLASNPALAHSEREQSLQALLIDSLEAVGESLRKPGVPTVLLWPESVYPRAFRMSGGMRAQVEDWVRRAKVHLVLASVDGEYLPAPDGSRQWHSYGVSLHLGPEGKMRGVYRKMALIPFGETIPFGDWFPAYRRLLKALVPRIAQFTPGTEHTVFTLDNGVKIAPMICFDAANETVARGMARNGARVGVVLANLAWFGRTSVASQFGYAAAFRAIENRMPILVLSQNGESFLLDSTGREASPRLPQYQRAIFAERVQVPNETPFYTRHGDGVNRLWVLLLAAALAWAAWAALNTAVNELLGGRRASGG